MTTTETTPITEPTPLTETDPITETRPEDVAEALVAALAHQDEAGVAALVAPGAWLRALLPRDTVEATTRARVVDAFRRWLGLAPELHLEDHECHAVEGRVHLRYRFVLRPDWEPARWHRIEQSGFAKVADGRITRLDLACTGYHPVEAP